MRAFRIAAAAAVIATAAIAPAVAQEKPLETYYARLSAQDHFNSQGRRLTTAAAIIRQDRANFHRFNRRDIEDESDRFFRVAENRARLEALIAEGSSTSDALSRVVNAEPLVRVEIYDNYVNVLVY